MIRINFLYIRFYDIYEAIIEETTMPVQDTIR